MAKNTIYYGFSLPPSTGGDYVSVEHVAGLNRQGFNAKVFYGAADDGYTRFDVPVARLGITFQPDDVLVIGEVHSFDAARAVLAIKVMHNQNPYMTFAGIESVAALNAYPLAHILTPSDFTASRLTGMGVKKTMHRVRPALPGYFAPQAKKLQIAYSPAKRGLEASFLQFYLAAMAPEYAHVPWVKDQGVPREAGAAVMAQSAVYAALPILEGLGLMTLEAMASGCHVVGYTGHGGAEYATPENGDWIAESDHKEFAAKLRAALKLFESGGPDPKVESGRATAAGFNQANFENELATAWKNILGDRAGPLSPLMS